MRRLITNLLACRAEFYEFPRKRSIPLCGMHDVNVASRVRIAKAALKRTAFSLLPKGQEQVTPDRTIIVMSGIMINSKLLFCTSLRKDRTTVNFAFGECCMMSLRSCYANPWSLRSHEPGSGSHNGATILHPNTKVPDFGGLFVFLGVKTTPFHHCTFSPTFWT